MERKKEAIHLTELTWRQLNVSIIGTNTLICNRCTEEQMEKIKDKRADKGKIKKVSKTDEERFMESLHIISSNNGKPEYGFPAEAFAKAMISCCGFTEGRIKKSNTKGAFRILGIIGQQGVDLVPLRYKEVRMKHDVTRIPKTRGANPVCRGEFVGWGVTLMINYINNFVSKENLMELLSLAGVVNGIGEKSPRQSCLGSNGTWVIDSSQLIGDNELNLIKS